MKTVDDLQEFHLAYLAISTWLIDKDQLGEFEQRKNYMWAFQQPLLSAIKANLHINFLKHPPNTPHKMKDVHEAVRYVLQNDKITPQWPYYSPIANLVAPTPSPMSNDFNIKQETFASVMATFSKTIADALSQNNCPQVAGPTPATRNTDCNFCSGPHFIRECAIVEEYVVAGKCRRNHEGKVILSTGAYVP